MAVHALVYLNHMERVLSSEELAKNVCTNPVLVRRVMSTLTLEKIAQALDVRFVDAPWHSGDVDEKCLICSGMAGVMENLYAQLNQQCIHSLAAVTIADIDRRLLKNGEELRIGE